MNEIRRLRHRRTDSSGGSSTPIRVCIEDDDQNERQAFDNGVSQEDDCDLDHSSYACNEDDVTSIKRRDIASLSNRRIRTRETGATNTPGEIAMCDVSGIDLDDDADYYDSYDEQ